MSQPPFFHRPTPHYRITGILGIQQMIHAMGDRLEGISQAAQLRAATRRGEG